MLTLFSFLIKLILGWQQVLLGLQKEDGNISRDAVLLLSSSSQTVFWNCGEYEIWRGTQLFKVNIFVWELDRTKSSYKTNKHRGCSKGRGSAWIPNKYYFYTFPSQVNNNVSFGRSFVKLVKSVVGWISRKMMMGNLRKKSVLEFLLRNGFLFIMLSHQWNRGTMLWFMIWSSLYNFSLFFWLVVHLY